MVGMTAYDVPNLDIYEPVGRIRSVLTIDYTSLLSSGDDEPYDILSSITSSKVYYSIRKIVIFSVNVFPIVCIMHTIIQSKRSIMKFNYI